MDLMGIEELETRNSGEGERRFLSLRPSFNPGSGATYGGHVFAQAVWAAAQTVREGMICHVSTDLVCYLFEFGLHVVLGVELKEGCVGLR